MNTLMIKDLSITEELDGRAMSAVRGGYSYGYPTSYFNFSPVYAPNESKTVTASQFITGGVNIENANGNNVALANCITSTINPCVNTSNNIKV
ncbi:hypothetical protein A6V36_18800 [Paraburkholderia ginsengiterrae]|uniref:Uncharacterized protein n=1 Tax=Paraburkholderia ginsengiterrae TaxID=1462993 RepID=A0A1A9MWF5_9BURK|nr:hypothetical protein [Paraburkholderia ginsengiterrae]OAJ52166.1 hypothetical protein A6V37_10980 [Paraburkholderia ginsengiterrae]OAJ63531.1 hypothetical protein A6V36_18800 [Paraburkholderia ginsengiterrae]